MIQEAREKAGLPVIPAHHMYRYRVVEEGEEEYLISCYCKHCHGTGVIGKLCDPNSSFTTEGGKIDYKRKTPITCKCVLKLGEEKDNE